MSTGPSWTFITTHAQVLLAIAKDPTARLQDVARAVGVTERTTQKVIRDLERAGYIRIFKDGRRNCYEINAGKNFRHPLAREHSISHLLALLNRSDGTRF